MAGGIGSRFWPKSRHNSPKQFIDILGIGKSLLQLTYDRFLKLCPAENIFIVTNGQYKELVLSQLPGIAAENILCEPSRNNTAPCIAYATFKLAAKDPHARMVVAPSDHFILKEDVFIDKVKLALDTAAHKEMLLTLGITPSRPDTGYGYIKFEKQGDNGVHKVSLFTEKPDMEKAREFVQDGNYVWNAGIFIWRAETAKEAFRQFCPDIYSIFEKGEAVYNTPAEQAFINENYPGSPNTSIDYAIMEKAGNVATIPADFGWSDLGTWASLYEAADKENGDGNVAAGGSIQLQDTSDCIIHLPENKLAVIRGLKNFIVVDDKDVLLIYPKQHEQEIKKVTEELRRSKKDHYL